ncbi:hypothetical protein ACFFK0_15320 [Paenibacillus chartarius]|uniref:Uncharacterized protein n=1 Tax=Paenibacillus chartarius TaxID=747481 RepID=A0ABV6DMD4_9BACL
MDLFLKPKPRLGSKATWVVSDRAKAIVKYYAQYTGYTEDEVVDQVLSKLKDDPEFIKWIKDKRRNKRAMAQIFSDTEAEESTVG